MEIFICCVSRALICLSWWLRLHQGYNIRYILSLSLSPYIYIYIYTSFFLWNLKNWTQIHFTQGLQIKLCGSVLTFRLFSSIPIEDIIFDHVKCQQGTVGSHRVCFMASCAGQWGSKGRSCGGAGKGGPGMCWVSGDSEDRAWGLRCYCWDHSSQREPDCGISEVTPGDEEMRNARVPWVPEAPGPKLMCKQSGSQHLSSKPQSSLIAPR